MGTTGVDLAEAADAFAVLVSAAHRLEALRAIDLAGHSGRIRFMPDGERIDVGIARYRVVNGHAVHVP